MRGQGNGSRRPGGFVELSHTDHFALIDATSNAWEVTVREIEKLFQSS